VWAASAVSTPITRVSRDGAADIPIPAFDNRLLVMQGWGYITPFADPQGVALLQEVTKLTLVPDLWLVS
jgi:hypothetical protein